MPDRKYKDAAALRRSCEKYFDQCDAEGRLYSEPGLLLHLGISVSSSWRRRSGGSPAGTAPLRTPTDFWGTVWSMGGFPGGE